jgi:hypothetical protein
VRPLERLAEEKPEHADGGGPEPGTDEVERDEPSRRHPGEPGDERHGIAQAVVEAEADEQKGSSTLELVPGALGRRLPLGPKGEDPASEFAPQEIGELVARETPGERTSHDPEQREVAAMRGEPTEDDDGLPLEECAEQHREIAVARKQGRKAQGALGIRKSRRIEKIQKTTSSRSA